MTAKVILTAAAHAAIEAVCRVETHGRETGGVLLGHEHPSDHLEQEHYEESAHWKGRLTVTLAGDPGPHAEQTPHTFHRDPDHALALARLGYARDRSIWIGEWHTHPNGPAHPSPSDLRAYAAIVNDPHDRIAAFVSIIVVPDRPRPQLDAWIITPGVVKPAVLRKHF